MVCVLPICSDTLHALCNHKLRLHTSQQNHIYYLFYDFCLAWWEVDYVMIERYVMINMRKCMFLVSLYGGRFSAKGVFHATLSSLVAAFARFQFFVFWKEWKITGSRWIKYCAPVQSMCTVNTVLANVWDPVSHKRFILNLRNPRKLLKNYFY